MIDRDKLMTLLHYDPETGVFTWREKPSRRVAVGALAGYARSDGYIVIMIARQPHFAHRLAWLYLYGDLPFNVDHMNGVRNDNRASNLRAATHAINQQNKRVANSNSRTGVLGVSKAGRGWRAIVGLNGKNHYSRTFYSIEEAQAEYVSMKRRLHVGGLL